MTCFNIVACVLICAHAAIASPSPVDKLDTAAYLGRWYQVYASATVKYTMELGANCVTADYGAVDGRSDEITVTNTVHPFGYKVPVSGYAVADTTKTGVFQVALGPPGSPADPTKPLPFSKANYIVAGLGPLVDGKYDYAIVTDPGMLSLYILTRDAKRFEAQHATDVLQTVKSLGFTRFYNKPLKTNQDGCTYSEEMSLPVIV